MSQDCTCLCNTLMNVRCKKTVKLSDNDSSLNDYGLFCKTHTGKCKSFYYAPSAEDLTNQEYAKRYHEFAKKTSLHLYPTTIISDGKPSAIVSVAQVQEQSIIDTNLCKCLKNVDSKEQCPHSAKYDGFCGIHRDTKCALTMQAYLDKLSKNQQPQPQPMIYKPAHVQAHAYVPIKAQASSIVNKPKPQVQSVIAVKSTEVKKPIYYDNQKIPEDFDPLKKNQCIFIQIMSQRRCNKYVDDNQNPPYLCGAHKTCVRNIYNKPGNGGVEDAIKLPIDMTKPYPPYLPYPDDIEQVDNEHEPVVDESSDDESVAESKPVVESKPRQIICPIKQQRFTCTDFASQNSIPITEEMFEFLRANPHILPKDIKYTRTHMTAE